MTLPDSRNTTYAAGTPVKANDLNDFQDSIIGAKHGPVELTIGAVAFVPSTAYGQLSFDHWGSDAGGDAFMYTLIKLIAGAVVSRIEVFGYDNGTSRITCNVYVGGAPGTSSIDYSDRMFSNGYEKSTTGAVGQKSIVFDSTDAFEPPAAGAYGSGLPYVYLPGEFLILNVKLPTGALTTTLGGVRVTYKVP